jgi:prenyltransferase beta subunit
MSLKLEMLQAARLAPKRLGDATVLVRQFIRRQQNADGSFKNRAGRGDLYYTVFGLNALEALAEFWDAAALEKYLLTLGTGENLDFIHLTCLARCWSALPGKMPVATRAGLLQRLGEWRAADGGYNQLPGASHSTVYACLLAGETFQALESKATELTPRRKEKTKGVKLAAALASLRFPLRLGVKFFSSLGTPRRPLLQILESLRSADGAFSNESGLPHGSTTATAAVVTLFRAVQAPVPPAIVPWLFARCQPRGGFVATPATPIPDLLSTAVALHALAALGVSLAAIREPCLDFIDSLWDNAGGFHGHWADDALDVEYTFYALLALGHLSI